MCMVEKKSDATNIGHEASRYDADTRYSAGNTAMGNGTIKGDFRYAGSQPEQKYRIQHT